ncbi:MAG: 2'-5' RNA ligase family protein [Roseburia sp.]|nr:2'-5' RNA ligase family protein [Roseburia sp.]
MYLVSIYFDEKTDKQIQKFMTQIAEKTGNTFMQDNHVPPHITVAAIETRDENVAIAELEKCVQKLEQGKLRFISTGTFFPQVLYLEPVLNEYLHALACAVNETVKELPETIVSPYYQPFSWLPHVTLAKQLSEEQMLLAFQTMQKRFTSFEGTVTRIGIAKTNPHRDLKVWELV